MMNDITLDTFVISDTHFGHKAVMKKEPSRQKALQEGGFSHFDELLVYRWNHAVNANDMVLHLGDVYFDAGYMHLARLYGEKLLIVGNNDIGRFASIQSCYKWHICHKIKLYIPEKKRIKKQLRVKFDKAQRKDPYANALVLDVGKERVMFSHFPMFSRKKNDRFSRARDVLEEVYKLCECSKNIHGHTHSKNTPHRFCVNVSCEQVGFAPVRLREIL